MSGFRGNLVLPLLSTARKLLSTARKLLKVKSTLLAKVSTFVLLVLLEYVLASRPPAIVVSDLQLANEV